MSYETVHFSIRIWRTSRLNFKKGVSPPGGGVKTLPPTKEDNILWKLPTLIVKRKKEREKGKIKPFQGLLTHPSSGGFFSRV